MPESSYTYLFIILFVIIILLIVACIILNVTIINRDDQLNNCKNNFLDFNKLYQKSINNPIPLLSFINNYKTEYKGEPLPYLSYDVSGKKLLSISGSNINQIPLVSPDPLSKPTVWRLTISSKDIKIGDIDNKSFWTLPNCPQSGDKIILSATGSVFNIDERGFLNIDDFTVGFENGHVVIIDNNDNTCSNVPFVLHVVGYSPSFAFTCSDLIITEGIITDNN